MKAFLEYIALIIGIMAGVTGLISFFIRHKDIGAGIKLGIRYIFKSLLVVLIAVIWLMAGLYGAIFLYVSLFEGGAASMRFLIFQLGAFAFGFFMAVPVGVVYEILTKGRTTLFDEIFGFIKR